MRCSRLRRVDDRTAHLVANGTSAPNRRSELSSKMQTNLAVRSHVRRIGW
jgi:hypothetical protein